MIFKILRKAAVVDRYGRDSTALYRDIKQGLFTPAVKMGINCTGWPEHEVDAIIRARIAGRSESEIKALVAELIRNREYQTTLTA